MNIWYELIVWCVLQKPFELVDLDSEPDVMLKFPWTFPAATAASVATSQL